MKVKNIGSSQFTDIFTGEGIYMSVRVAENIIGLGLSQESNGDVEAYMDVKECERLVEWLMQALSIAKSTE